MVHYNTPPGEKYAPIEIHKELVDLLISDVADAGGEKGKGKLMDAADVARSRIRREKDSPPLDAVHAEIARGEMAIILGVLEMKGDEKVGVPVEWMREWISEERMPTGWKPTHVQGLLDTVKRSKAIRTAMDEQRKADGNEKKVS